MITEHKIALSKMDITDLIYLNHALLRIGEPNEVNVLSVGSDGNVTFPSVCELEGSEGFNLHTFASSPDEATNLWEMSRMDLVREGVIRDAEVCRLSATERILIRDRERIMMKAWRNRFTFYERVNFVKGNDETRFTVVWLP